MKKLLAILLITTALYAGIPVQANTAQSDSIKIKLNNQLLVSDQDPIIRNGTTLMPMRAIFEAFGLDVDYDPVSATAFSTLDNSSFEVCFKNNPLSLDTHIIIDPDINAPLDEYHYYKFTYPPVIISGRTMIPVRFLAESTGCKVEWDGNTKTVIITGTPTKFQIIPGGLKGRV